MSYYLCNSYHRESNHGSFYGSKTPPLGFNSNAPLGVWHISNPKNEIAYKVARYKDKDSAMLYAGSFSDYEGEVITPSFPHNLYVEIT
jgi:hypothetical protein